MIYENYKLCADLTPSEICLVVQQYKEGEIIRKFHKHVPKSRLNQDEQTNLLRALVIHFSGVGPETLSQHFLNKRGKTPSAIQLQYVISYPEPGVLRTYCGVNTTAWSDKVIAPEGFRVCS